MRRREKQGAEKRKKGVRRREILLWGHCMYSPVDTLHMIYLKSTCYWNIQMACDDLKQKFQHAEYITCNPLIAQPISNCQMSFPILYRSYQKKWRSNCEVNRWKWWQIAGNHRKFHSKNNGDHFFEKLRHRGHSKKQWRSLWRSNFSSFWGSRFLWLHEIILI